MGLQFSLLMRKKMKQFILNVFIHIVRECVKSASFLFYLSKVKDLRLIMLVYNVLIVYGKVQGNLVQQVPGNVAEN